MNWKLLTLPLVALMVLGIGAIACSSDDDGDGDALTLEGFLQELEQLDQTFNQRGDELDAEFEAGFQDVETEEDAIALGQQFFNDLTSALQEFVDGIEDLNAPDEAQELQDDAVSAGRAVLEEMDGVIDQLNDAETEADFEAITGNEELNTAFSAFDQVCMDAQALADENSVAVTFTCEDE